MTSGPNQTGGWNLRAALSCLNATLIRSSDAGVTKRWMVALCEPMSIGMLRYSVRPAVSSSSASAWSTGSQQATSRWAGSMMGDQDKVAGLACHLNVGAPA